MSVCQKLSPLVAIVFVCQTVCADDLSNLIPENDHPAQIVSVAGRKYPVENKYGFNVSGGQYVGDKLAQSLYLSVAGRKYLSEKSYLGLGFYYVSSTVNADYDRLHSFDGSLSAYQPSKILNLTYGWMPIYGKFAFGEDIGRFRAGLRAGPAVLQLSPVSETSNKNTDIVFGAQLGAFILLHTSEHWFVETSFDTLIHPQSKLLGDAPGFRLDYLWALSIGYTL